MCARVCGGVGWGGQVSAAARAHRLLLAGLLLGPAAGGPAVHTMVRADLRMSATQVTSH